MSVLEPPPPDGVPALVGDPGAVGACADRVLVASAALGVLDDGPATDGWTGRAAAAEAAAAAGLRRRAQRLALAQRHLGVGLLAHAAALRLLAAERERLTGRAAALAGERLALLPLLRASPPAPDAVARARVLADDLGDHARAVAAWVERCAKAGADLVAACRAAAAAARDEAPPDGVPADDPADAAVGRLVATLAVDVVPGTGADGPARAARWWEALDTRSRWAVLAAAPGLVGRLDGLPARVRDRANRLALARDLATLRARSAAGALHAVERRRLRHAEAAHEALARARSRADPRGGSPAVALLWDYAPAAHRGDGAVAVSLGDLDAADHVAVLVPGLGTDAAAAPARAADAWRLVAAARGATDDSVAAVAWIGYDAPSRWAGGDLDAWRVVDQRLARDGGAELARDLDGLLVARGDDPHLSVVGHSYGATTAAHAAAGAGLPADDLVLLGSPGAGPAGHADELRGPTGEARVWVGSASSDLVTRVGDEGWVGGPGTLGADPAAEEFGARRFRAEDAARDAGVPWSPHQHRGYLRPGGESLAAVALVVAGRHHDVPLAAGRRDPWWGPAIDPEARRALDVAEAHHAP